MLHEVSYVEQDGSSGRDEHGLSESDFFHELGDDAEGEDDEAHELEETSDSLTHGDHGVQVVFGKRRQNEWKGPSAPRFLKKSAGACCGTRVEKGGWIRG
jgi:hypothetical protein